MLALKNLEMERGGLRCCSTTFGELVFLFSVVAMIQAGTVFVGACKRGE